MRHMRGVYTTWRLAEHDIASSASRYQTVDGSIPWLETMHVPIDYRFLACGECRHVTVQESGTTYHQHQTLCGCLSVRISALANGEIKVSPVLMPVHKG
jgi:hypothetical protein